MLSDLFFYSLRNLWTRKLRTLLTMIGIVIGITAVVALVGLGNGLREAVTGQFNLAGPDVLSIQASGGGQGPPGFGVPRPLDKSYIDGIDRLSSVDTSIGIIIASLSLEFNRVQQIGLIQSFPDDHAKLQDYLDILSITLDDGRFPRAGETGRIVIGHSIRERSRDRFGRNLDVGSVVLLNGNSYEVVGVMSRRGSFIFDESIRMVEADVRRETGDDDAYNFISVRARSLRDVDRAREDIERYLRTERNVREGKEDFSVETAESSLETLDSILTGIQVFIVLIAAISMIVGAIGIVNTMFTSVMERTREIGIMKAIGATNGQIFKLFFLESGLLGFVGGAIGILLGWSIASFGTSMLAVLFNTDAGANITLPLILGALAGSFLIGSISGIVPAMQAAKMQPVKALRGG